MKINIPVKHKYRVHYSVFRGRRRIDRITGLSATSSYNAVDLCAKVIERMIDHGMCDRGYVEKAIEMKE